MLCYVLLQVGYPLVTVLVCLVDSDNYTRQVESMADFLVKQMKVKEYRQVFSSGRASGGKNSSSSSIWLGDALGCCSHTPVVMLSPVLCALCVSFVVTTVQAAVLQVPQLPGHLLPGA